MRIAHRFGWREKVIDFSAAGGRWTTGAAAWKQSALVLLFCIASASAALIASGQSSQGGDTPGASAESAAQIMRAQAVLIELPLIIQRDAELQSLFTAFESALEKAMVDQDPQTAQRQSRLSDLQAKATAGEASEQRGLDEGRKLRDALLATAAKARNQSAVAATEKPFVVALKKHIEGLEGIDADTKELVTTGDLLINVVTMMSVLNE